jgi:membrane associated rhomboid family serine protease
MRDLPPRRRSSAPAWTRPIAERLTPTVKALVLTQTVLYLFYLFVPQSHPLFEGHLAVGPGLFHGELWQPLSALFVHFNFLGFVFNLIGLWFVGAFIERTNGTRRFLQLFFGSGILAFVALALVARLRPTALGEGCSYAVLALFVAFGRMYDRSPAQILGGLVMQARHLAMLLVGFAVAMDLARGDFASLAATLVASAAGLVLGGRSGGLSLRDALALFRARRLRRRYRVLDGGQAGARSGVSNSGVIKSGIGKSGAGKSASSKKKDKYWN